MFRPSSAWGPTAVVPSQTCARCMRSGDNLALRAEARLQNAVDRALKGYSPEVSVRGPRPSCSAGGGRELPQVGAESKEGSFPRRSQPARPIKGGKDTEKISTACAQGWRAPIEDSTSFPTCSRSESGPREVAGWNWTDFLGTLAISCFSKSDCRGHGCLAVLRRVWARSADVTTRRPSRFMDTFGSQSVEPRGSVLQRCFGTTRTSIHCVPFRAWSGDFSKPTGYLGEGGWRGSDWVGLVMFLASGCP